MVVNVEVVVNVTFLFVVVVNVTVVADALVLPIASTIRDCGNSKHTS